MMDALLYQTLYSKGKLLNVYILFNNIPTTFLIKGSDFLPACVQSKVLVYEFIEGSTELKTVLLEDCSN